MRGLGDHRELDRQLSWDEMGVWLGSYDFDEAFCERVGTAQHWHG